MKTTSVLMLAALLLAGPTATVHGTTVVGDAEDLPVELVTDIESRVAVAEVSLSAPTGLTRAQVGFAAIEFDAPLPDGSVVELWMACGEDTALPWLSETKGASRKIQHWVVDEFTGNWVRLDVTRVLRELASTAIVQRLYVRVLDDEGEPIPLAFAENGGPRLTEVRIR